MGLLDKLKEKGRGVVTAVKPAEGLEPQPAAVLRQRLLDISGQGIKTGEDEDAIAISWAAKVASSGADGAEFEYLYRAIRVNLDEDEHTATGLCFKTTAEADLGFGNGFTGSKSWEKGQFIGSESVHIIAWLGAHQTEGGAGESGYKFSWAELRELAIDAVIGAGWNYKPKKF